MNPERQLKKMWFKLEPTIISVEQDVDYIAKVSGGYIYVNEDYETYFYENLNEFIADILEDYMPLDCEQYADECKKFREAIAGVANGSIRVKLVPLGEENEA